MGALRTTSGKYLPVLLLGVLLLLTSSFAACGQPQPTGEYTSYIHYANTEGAYSVEYPSGWELEEINPDEIAIHAKDSWNQVQIGSFEVEDTGPISDEMFHALGEANVRTFCGAMGFENVTIITNEAVSGKWDWATTFSFTYDSIPFFGTFLVKQTTSRIYTFTILQVGDFPEGLKVLDSFTIVYS
jgi:hypothetical protein